MKSNPSGEELQHQKKMMERKALVDEGIKTATESRGIVILLTGNGKGKTSSALGMAIRSLGHGLRVGVVQFIKGPWLTGERLFFQGLSNTEFYTTGEGFTWETQDKERDKMAARNGWNAAAKMLADDQYHLVILDELTYLFHYEYLEITPTLIALRSRPRHQNVIVTGRHAIPELIELADTVSEVHDCKHAFRAGIKAQKGIEW